MPTVELATRISNKMKMAAAAGITPDDLWDGYLANRPNPNRALKPIDVLKAVGIPINYPEYYIAVRDRANGNGKNIPDDKFKTLCTELSEGQITPVNRRPTERYRPDEVPQTPKEIEDTINTYVTNEEKETYYLLDAAKVARIPYHDSTIDELKKTAEELGILTTGTKVPMNEEEFRRLSQVLLENKPKVEPDWLEKWMDQHFDKEDFKMKDVYDATRRDDTDAIAKKIRELLREIDNSTAESKFVSMTRDEFTLICTMIGVVNPYKSDFTSKTARKLHEVKIGAEKPQKRTQTGIDVKLTEGKEVLTGAGFVKKKRVEFTAANNPRVWTSENEKRDYGIDDIVLATGRKSAYNNAKNRVREILRSIGIDPAKRYTAEEVITTAEIYGPPAASTAKKRNENKYLNELGIIIDTVKPEEKPFVPLYPGQDPKFARVSELLNRKNTRTGEKPPKDGEEANVPKILTVRQEAGLDLSEKILSSLRNQVVEDLNVELVKDPRKLVENIDLPQNYKIALRSLDESQAKIFIAEVTKEVIERAWGRNDLTSAGQTIDMRLRRYIHGLQEVGVKLGEVLYYIHSYYNVPIPQDDKSYIPSDLLRERRFRVRGPRHNNSKL